MENLGHKVRKFREIRGYKQKHVADELGMSRTTYGNLENGKTEISDERLQKIAVILDTTPEAIKAYDPRMVFNINHQKGDYAGHIIINNSIDNLPEIIELVLAPHLARIKELEERVKQLSNELEGFSYKKFMDFKKAKQALKSSAKESINSQRFLISDLFNSLITSVLQSAIV